MKDWADKIELTIADAYSAHGAILAADADGMIAAALRKAKADGMREIADSARRYEGWTIVGIANDINSRANQIEKGQ